MSDAPYARRPLTVGIGTRSYNSHYGYAGLAPPAVRYVPTWRVPLNRLRPGSLTALNTYVPLDPRVDLLHLMNGIPVAGWPTPWLTSFESMLPRLEARSYGGRLDNLLVRRLLSSRCRALLAWSSAAVGWLSEMHEPEVATALAAKTQIFTGSTGPPVAEARKHELPLRVAFIGGELLRKGGVAVLRAARRAAEALRPIEFTVVGSLDRATDVTPPWERYRGEARELLRYVNHVERMTPDQTRRLIGESHVLLLPSLQETLGWVTLEAMQRATVPVVAGIAVQRELVGCAGVCLEVELGPGGRWIGLDAPTPERRSLTQAALETLTDGTFRALERFVEDRSEYESQSAAALSEYRSRFDPRLAGERLRRIYDAALSRPASLS